MSEKSAATWHPYRNAAEAMRARARDALRRAQEARAEREFAEHQKQVRGLMYAIAKRTTLG